jgi:hypothetical protein
MKMDHVNGWRVPGRARNTDIEVDEEALSINELHALSAAEDWCGFGVCKNELFSLRSHD